MEKARRMISLIIPLVSIGLSVLPLVILVGRAQPNMEVVATPSTMFTFDTTTITATLTGSRGEPLAGVAVVFNASGAQGEFGLSPSVARTGDDGKAAMRWTAGNEPGVVTVYARATVGGATARIVLSADVAVTVRNRPPTAEILSFSPHPAIAKEPLVLAFSGTDLDGRVTIFELDWGDGSPSSTGKLVGNDVRTELEHVYDAPGDYGARIRVLDNYEAWSSWVSASLSVTERNHPPTAYMDSVEPNPGDQDDTFSFSGHGEDPDGNVIGYRWRSNIDGLLSTSNSFSISNLSVGSHTISFQVQDDQGAWSEEVRLTLSVRLPPETQTTTTTPPPGPPETQTTTTTPPPGPPFGATGPIIVVGVAGAVAAIAAVGVYAYMRKGPSSSEIEQELGRRQAEERERQEEDEKKRKRKEKEARLEWSITAPARTMGTSFRASVKVRNQGSSAAKDVLIRASVPPGFSVIRSAHTLPEIKPNESRDIDFRFRVDKASRKGIFAFMFTLRSKETPAQTKRHFLRVAKIGLLSQGIKPQPVQTLSQWLTKHAYNWDTIPSADDYLKLLRYDIIITAPEMEVSPKSARNLSNFVENGQSILAIDKIESSEAQAVARALGYSSMQYVSFKTSHGLLRITGGQHPVTRRFGVGHTIDFGPMEGHACKSPPSTGRVLAALEIRMGDKLVKASGIVSNQYGKGRALHFNFNAGGFMIQLNTVFDESVKWLLIQSIDQEALGVTD